MEETWKDVEHFNGYYQISNSGRIKNHKGKILKQHIDADGYHKIKLKDRKTYIIHRLVAKAFIDNTDNLPCVNHKDENKSNNSADNLEWCSISYNINYGNRNKLVAKKNAREIEQYNLEGVLIKSWASVSEASRELKISSGDIVSSCKGRYKQANGYIFKYKEE